MSNLSYFVNQLDRFDTTLHEPLYNVTWTRDIALRTDVSIFNESTSFTRSSFGFVGSSRAGGKPWLAQNSNTLPNISVDGERIVTPVLPLGFEISYTSIELEKSAQLQQPIDVQKYNGMTIGYNMAIDNMVYIGDTDTAATGMVNSPLITTGPIANPTFALSSADEIIASITELLEETYKASGYAVCPDKLLLPHPQFALLVSKKIAVESGNLSVLTYLQDNSLSLKVNGRPLDIQPSKWLNGVGVGGTDRMVAYSQEEKYLRFPLVPIRRETAYHHGINFNAPYIWAMGSVEFVYTETIQYRDGI